VERARAHRRLAGIGCFALLALVTEVVGRSLTVRFDLGSHVPTPSYSGSNYYPFLLGFVKVSVALMLAGLTWRAVRARTTLARAGGRGAPRVRIELSVRSWALTFALTATFYLVQTDTERIAAGHWPLMSPWLHTSALSVFAVLSVLAAVLYGAVSRWLTEYERFAAETAAACGARPRTATVFHAREESDPPRRLFGLAFECRPPPLTA
jgi:hypothetical protein